MRVVSPLALDAAPEEEVDDDFDDVGLEEEDEEEERRFFNSSPTGTALNLGFCTTSGPLRDIAPTAPPKARVIPVRAPVPNFIDGIGNEAHAPEGSLMPEP